MPVFKLPPRVPVSYSMNFTLAQIGTPAWEEEVYASVARVRAKKAAEAAQAAARTPSAQLTASTPSAQFNMFASRVDRSPLTSRASAENSADARETKLPTSGGGVVLGAESDGDAGLGGEMKGTVLFKETDETIAPCPSAELALARAELARSSELLEVAKAQNQNVEARAALVRASADSELAQLRLTCDARLEAALAQLGAAEAAGTAAVALAKDLEEKLGAAKARGAAGAAAVLRLESERDEMRVQRDAALALARARADAQADARPAAGTRRTRGVIGDVRALYLEQFAAVAHIDPPPASLDQPVDGLSAKDRCANAFYALTKRGEILPYLAAGNALADVICEELDLAPNPMTVAEVVAFVEDQRRSGTHTAIKKVTFAFMLAALHVAATRNFSSRYSKHKLILAKLGWERMYENIFKIMQPARAGPRVQLLLAIDVLFARDPRVIKDASRPSYDFKTNEVMVYSILEELYA